MGSILEQFCGFSKELDTRNDKSERIVKVSRDITIESKRTICLLQRTQFQCPEEREKTIGRAESNLAKLRKFSFSKLAKELEGESPFHFNRSFTFGLQEYIEALSFLHYLKDGTLISHQQVQKDLIFKDPPAAGPPPRQNQDDDGKENSKNEAEMKPSARKTIKVFVSQHDFILGLFDLTGELMRVATNANPVDGREFINNTCKFLQLIHQGTSGFSGYRTKEFSRKTSTLMSSVAKLESLVYNLKIREMDAFGGNMKIFVDVFEGDNHNKGRNNFDDNNYDSGNE